MATRLLVSWALRPADQVDGNRAGYRPVDDYGTHAGPGACGDDIADDSRRWEGASTARRAPEAVDPHASADHHLPAAAGAGRVNDL